MTLRQVQLLDADGNSINPTVSLASADGVGVIKPDGTTISVANDGTASVIAGSLDNRILPDDYTITVATDGSGDFTDIQSALNSLDGKVCAGTVTISIAAGTYTLTNQISFTNSTFNIDCLILQGAGTDITILNCATVGSYNKAIYIENNNSLVISKLTINNTGSASDSRSINITTNSRLYIESLKISNFNAGLFIARGSLVTCGNLTISSATNCVICTCSTFTCSYGSITLSGCATGFRANSGGIVGLNSVSLTTTSVTNVYGSTINVLNSTGGLIAVGNT